MDLEVKNEQEKVVEPAEMARKRLLGVMGSMRKNDFYKNLLSENLSKLKAMLPREYDSVSDDELWNCFCNNVLINHFISNEFFVNKVNDIRDYSDLAKWIVNTFVNKFCFNNYSADFKMRLEKGEFTLKTDE